MRPDAVVTIDSSGFSWRIAQRLRRRGETLPLIHYVAPMVWAWRAGRARRMARWYDHLLTLLPFEPPYFERVGLACQPCRPPGPRKRRRPRRRGPVSRRARHRRRRTGDHRAAGQPGRRGAASAADLRRGAAPPGDAWSGRSASSCRPSRLSPTPSPPGSRDWPGRPHRAARQCRANTTPSPPAARRSPPPAPVALELAMAGLPMVVAYRLNPLTEALLDRARQGAAGQPRQPAARPAAGAEHLRDACTPEPLAASLAVSDPRRTGSQRRIVRAMMKRCGGLRGDGTSPSRAAADRILRDPRLSAEQKEHSHDE